MTNIYEIYTDNLLGKTSLESAKQKIIEESLELLFYNAFENLANEKSTSTPEALSEIFKDMNGWIDEDFVYEKHHTLEALVFIPAWFKHQDRYVRYYNKFLIEKWHHNHEHLLAVLSSLKSETSVPFINIAINTNYKYLILEDSTYASFIRKCMWALADINTPESIEILQAYKNDESEVKRACADEQLRWLNGEPGMRVMW